MLRIREDNDFRAPSGTLAGGSVGSLTGLHGGNRGAGAHGGVVLTGPCSPAIVLSALRLNVPAPNWSARLVPARDRRTPQCRPEAVAERSH